MENAGFVAGISGVVVCDASSDDASPPAVHQHPSSRKDERKAIRTQQPRKTDTTSQSSNDFHRREQQRSFLEQLPMEPWTRRQLAAETWRQRRSGGERATKFMGVSSKRSLSSPVSGDRGRKKGAGGQGNLQSAQMIMGKSGAGNSRDQSPTEIGLLVSPPLPTLQTSALRTPVEALHIAVPALRPIALAAPPPPATAAQQRRTEIAKDGMDLPETFLNKRTTEEQSQPGVVCPSVPAGFSLTSQQISPDAAPWGGRAPEHQDQTRTQEFSSVSRSPPAASSEYPRLSPVKDQVTAPVGPKARDRPKLGGGPSGAGKLPPQEACWHCGSRDPDHLSELCPELPRNKLTAGICERPRCQKPRHPDYVTCWECRKYRRNTERYVLEATPPYIPPATGGATDGYGTGPNAHRSDYSTGQSAPPHPKRWYYVSASTTLPPGTYTYNSLRRHLESQGGWSATDRWSQGSYQGFVEAEPALKRTVQAGLRRPDGSLPVYYD